MMLFDETRHSVRVQTAWCLVGAERAMEAKYAENGTLAQALYCQNLIGQGDVVSPSAWTAAC